MERTLKTKLLCYLVVSAISFSYLIMPQKAGISVPVFIIIQFICLFSIVPAKKALLLFVPIFILALNSFISGNDIWHASNFIVTIILYGVMLLMMTEDTPLKGTSVNFIFNIIRNILMPFNYFDVPVKWGMETNQAKARTIKRVLIGIVIAIPCIAILILVLSSADQIFSSGVANIFTYLQSVFNIALIFKIVCGIVAGFYLFGLAYYIFQPKKDISASFDFKSGDLIVINIVLIAILCIYTIFAVIQFRYLFASSGQLPYGLTYTYYARRGFFELLFLSGVNIFIILLTLKLTQKHTGFGMRLTQGLCCYLCVITFILLASSFYRMWLYNLDGGLTRLRFLVFGFLIFEAVGLVFTFIYILKPKFNIIATYLLIGLVYYLLLNLVPMDAIIAKDQINRYFATGKGDLEYALSLSSDAAPQIARLLDENDIKLRNIVEKYFIEHGFLSFGWRGFNLSAEKCRLIYEQAIFKKEELGVTFSTAIEMPPKDYYMPDELLPVPEMREISLGKSGEIEGKSIQNIKLPANTKIYAAGAYSGLKLDWQIDNSGHQATLIEVVVNSFEDPVVLILGAYEPTVWHVKWTKDTNIVAVVVSGYHTQKVIGPLSNVPIFCSTYENKGIFNYFYIKSSGDITAANRVSKQLFKREIDKAFDVVKGLVVVGKTTPAGAMLITDTELREENFTNPDKPLAGEAGLVEAMRNGLIKKATNEDIQEYLTALSMKTGTKSGYGGMRPDAYVVLSPDFIIPPDLYGAHSVTFLLPKGMPQPRGPVSHCTFFSLD